VVDSDVLPSGPRVHLAPDGFCTRDSPTSVGCVGGPDLLCRGTIEWTVLSLSEDSAFEAWSVGRMVAPVVVSFGFESVPPVDELTPDVDRALCAVYPPEGRWCPGS